MGWRGRAVSRSGLVVVALGSALIGCSSNSDSTSSAVRELISIVDRTAGATRSTAAKLNLETDAGNTVWAVQGATTQVADAIAANSPPDERSDDATEGNVFLLYSAATVRVARSNVEGTSAVVLDPDNDRAYRRHSSFLSRNGLWLTRLGRYRSAGGSASAFRGGGSSTGK